MSTEKNTTEILTRILVEQLGIEPEQVKPEANITEDLLADSLDQVELVMAIEEEWNVEIPDEDAEKLETVGQWVAYLDELEKPAG